MSATEIAQRLGGFKRSGTGYIGPCPVHDDRSPSFSISDGKDGRLLVKCFAGCDPLDILAAINAIGAGFSSQVQPADREDIRADAERDAAKRTSMARTIWRECEDVAGTAAERYLRLRVPGYDGPFPASLRSHAGLKHSSTGLTLPAMVGAITVWPSREITAIHRTFLQVGGGGKAPVSSPKMMLGPVSSGAVRLGPASESIAVCEGIETGLAVMASTGTSTWAALSAGGLECLLLPPLPLAADVLIAADNDASGRGQIAAERAAKGWIAEGRQVRISIPPDVGRDWADYPVTDEIRGAA